jgi:Na+/melibiose symporter-like transporter
MADRLKKSLIYTYGIADLFFGLLIAMEVYFFPIFLTDYARFSLAIAGNILLITSIADIGCTFGGGVLLQKSTLRLGGKYRSWFLIGPVIAAPLFVFQFTKIGRDTTAALIIVLGFVVSHVLFNIVYSAGGAMVGRLSKVPEEITLLSASRAQGMTAAGILFSVTGLPMILFFGRFTNDVKAHAIAVGIYAILMMLGYWYLFKITSGKDPYDEATLNCAKRESRKSVADIIAVTLHNPPLIFLFVADIFRNAYIFFVTGFAIYYFKYVLNRRGFVPVFILAVSIAGLIGSLAASWIGVKMGKRRAYWVSLALATVAFASGNYLPESSWIVTAACCVGSMFGMVAGAMSTALFSDTVVYGEWKTGRNVRAFIMAMCNVPIKIGIFIRNAVLSIGLAAIGFVANATPSRHVIDGIRTIMLFAPAASCALAALFFYFGYRIEDRQVMRMQQELDQSQATIKS